MTQHRAEPLVDQFVQGAVDVFPRRRNRRLYPGDERSETRVRHAGPTRLVDVVPKPLEDDVKLPGGVLLGVHAEHAPSFLAARSARARRRRRRVGGVGGRGRVAKQPPAQGERGVGHPLVGFHRPRVHAQLAKLVGTPRVYFAQIANGDGVPGTRHGVGDVHPRERRHERRLEPRVPIAVPELPVQSSTPRVHPAVAGHGEGVVSRRGHLHGVDTLQRSHRCRDHHALSDVVNTDGHEAQAVAQLPHVAVSPGVHLPARRGGRGGVFLVAHVNRVGYQIQRRWFVEHRVPSSFDRRRLGGAGRGIRADRDGVTRRRRDRPELDGLEVHVPHPKPLHGVTAVGTEPERELQRSGRGDATSRRRSVRLASGAVTLFVPAEHDGRVRIGRVGEPRLALGMVRSFGAVQPAELPRSVAPPRPQRPIRGERERVRVSHRRVDDVVPVEATRRDPVYLHRFGRGLDHGIESLSRGTAERPRPPRSAQLAV